MTGILGGFNQWMTPERAIALQGIGLGLSQMSQGYGADLSSAHSALAQRQQQSGLRRALDNSDIMGRFSPDQQAILAQMPAEAAIQIITGELFRRPEAPKPTDDMREYEFAKSQGYVGSFEDWQISNRRAGAANQTVNVGPTGIDYGDPPKDMAWARDENGAVQLDERGAPVAVIVRGSPSDVSQTQKMIETAGDAISSAEKEGLRKSSEDTASETVVRAARLAREAAGDRNLGAAGTSLVGMLPWTDSAEVMRQTDSLKAIASAENLNAMRKQSETGGALGNVTEKELKLLENMAGALDPNSPNYVRDLDNYERTLLRTIHGKEEGDRIFEKTRGAAEISDADLFSEYGLE